MTELIKIQNQQINVKEFNNQRVVTFKDVDMVHERAEGTSRRNFNTNKVRLIKGEDFFVRNSSEAKKEFGITAPNGLVLLTESGYLMLVKSFTDDLAWQVQRQLVKSYFRKKSMTTLEQIQLLAQGNVELEKKVDAVDKDLQDFKQDMPILGVEEGKITSAVRRKGVECLGGKDSEAYKDNSIRGKVYADIYGQLKREFGVDTYKAIKRSQCDEAVKTINSYQLPYVLQETINDCNAQVHLY